MAKLDSSSPSSYGILGTIQELEDISPKMLSCAYTDLMQSDCDIYLIGDLDMDLVANLIFKYFKNPVVKTDKNLSLYVENKCVKKLETMKNYRTF